MFIRTLKAIVALCALFSGAFLTSAQDLPNSKDPAGMKRYEGSELIGYRAPIFDEYLLPLGPPSSFSPPAYEKSKPVEGQVSYYTYLAPAGRSPAELYRNYKQEFQRLGIEIQYEKNAGHLEILVAPSTRLITIASSHKSFRMTAPTNA
jgi:OmpA-OmpF porin, OOP family